MNVREFSEKNKFKKLGWLHDSLKFIAIFVALFIVFRFVIGVSIVSGESMYPTYKDGQVVVYLRVQKSFKTGDVVCIWVPSGNYYIKRVAAVGGDEVDIEDGILYVNGVQESNEYAKGRTLEEEGALVYPYVVSEGNYFVLGDNREESMDSRAFGEVSRLQVRGKILLSIGRGHNE